MEKSKKNTDSIKTLEKTVRKLRCDFRRLQKKYEDLDKRYKSLSNENTEIISQMKMKFESKEFMMAVEESILREKVALLEQQLQQQPITTLKKEKDLTKKIVLKKKMTS